MVGIPLNQQSAKIILLIALSFSLAGCQYANNEPLDTMSHHTVSNKVNLPFPCKKNTSLSPIKNKEKLKKMLLKEGKITKDMSKNEVNQYINKYIKRKHNSKCKPALKRSAFIIKEPKYA